VGREAWGVFYSPKRSEGERRGVWRVRPERKTKGQGDEKTKRP